MAIERLEQLEKQRIEEQEQKKRTEEEARLREQEAEEELRRRKLGMVTVTIRSGRSGFSVGRY